MIEAFGLCFRCGTASRAQLNCAVRRTSRQRSQSSGLISSTRPVGPAMPALFTSTSSPPSACSPSSKKQAASARSDTSPVECVQVGIARGQAVERRSINVSDTNARALPNEGAGDLQPDPVRPGSDKHAQALNPKIHGGSLRVSEKVAPAGAPPQVP